MPTVPSVAELRKICYKENSQPLSKYVIRPYIAIYLTRLFLLMGINGDTITIAMGLVGVAGALLFLSVNPWLLAGACGLMLFGWVLDHVDGQMLTYQKQSSAFGILLDRLTHVIEYPLMHLCLGWSLGAQTPELRLLGVFNAIALLYMGSAKAEVKLLALEGYELPKRPRKPHPRGVRRALRIAWGLFSSMTFAGYGPYVLFALLGAIALGVLREYFILLSFCVYWKLLRTYADILLSAYRMKTAPPRGGFELNRVQSAPPDATMAAATTRQSAGQS
jgi:hypothetical protein